MRYQGGKVKIAKEILAEIGVKGENFVEPFAGGLNVSWLASQQAAGVWCNDIRYELIECYKAILSGWIPPKIDRQTYDKARAGALSPEMTGWCAVGCSYGGKWFGGLALTDSSGVRDYQNESLRAVKKQLSHMSGVVFTSLDYREMHIPDGSVVYCDPPYAGTTGYGIGFSHRSFWRWCRILAKRCDVYVSEYSAPDDVECIWLRDKHSPLGRTGKKAVERLYRL